MKKIGVLFAMILVVGMVSNSFAQKDRTLSNGFSVNAVIGFPSETYGAESDAEISDDFKFGTLFGIQVGNRWYFNPSDQYGLGLMVNWVDVSLAAKGGTVDGTDFGRAAIDFTFLELGPVGTIVVADGMAIDAYYNLRPTVMSSALVSTLVTGDETFAYAGFGFSHAIGAAFRVRAFNVGVEYVAGGINSKGTYTGDMNLDLEDAKIQTNSLRIMIGLKF